MRWKRVIGRARHEETLTSITCNMAVRYPKGKQVLRRVRGTPVTHF
jgi:hypothetical protein